MHTAIYQVQGMTCGHCVAAVAEELDALTGVAEVNVTLNTVGTSTVTVTSADPLNDDVVTEALNEAGNYRLTGRDQSTPNPSDGPPITP